MIHKRWIYYISLICALVVRIECEVVDQNSDWLHPYSGRHGSIHSHRVVRETQPYHYGNTTYEEYPPHHTAVFDDETHLVDHRAFVFSYMEYWNTEYVSGHHIVVADPDKTVSVLEPGGEGGCHKNMRSTVRETGQAKNCLVAVNAGFFNTTSGECYSDVISDGRVVHSSGGVQNAHFGIDKDGSLFFGYIPDYVSIPESFDQLVGGVIWLVRNGENYIETSQQAESDSTQETGSLPYFISVHSARTAVGHDREGHLVIVAVDGHTGERGIPLTLFADLLIDLGVVNAINLDGGGSTTVIINNTLVNYPGDRCNISGFLYSCEREVSTVVCVHDIPCDPVDCSNHGDCFHGTCQCQSPWTGPACSVLQCGEHNCSGHGHCTEAGCDCYPGYHGTDCHDVCPPGYYGLQCSQTCPCRHGEACDPVDGHCLCAPGYHGYLCDTECGYGTYGEECRGVCDCADSCTCDPYTGRCHNPTTYSSEWQVGHCMGDRVIVRRDLITVDSEQYFLLMALLVMMCAIALGSIILNVILLSREPVSGLSSMSELKSPTRGPDRSPVVMDTSEDEKYDSDNHHNDADVESIMSEDGPRSIFYKLPFIKKRQKQTRDLWQNWKRKFRRKNQERPFDENISIQDTFGVYDAAYRSDHGAPLDVSAVQNPDINDTRAECQRNSSVNTEDLLDEISLELSSPDHVSKDGDLSQHGEAATSLSAESFYRSQSANNVFHAETMF